MKYVAKMHVSPTAPQHRFLDLLKLAKNTFDNFRKMQFDFRIVIIVIWYFHLLQIFLNIIIHPFKISFVYYQRLISKNKCFHFFLICFENMRWDENKANTYSIYQTSMKNTKRPNKLSIKMSFVHIYHGHIVD